MAKQKSTGIGWTTFTFNPIRGCTKVSEGCKNCYAEELSKRNPATLGIWGDNGTRVLASDAMWKEPIKWNREAEGAKERPRVFCASLADVFEDWDGPIHDSKGMVLGKQFEPADSAEMHNDDLLSMDDVRLRLFELIDHTPNLDWLLLTKRPENIQRMWPLSTYPMDHGWEGFCKAYRQNVWLGTTVENQEQADKRIPELLGCRDLSPVLFLSCEPLLGPVDLRKVKTHEGHEDVLFVGNEGGYEYAGGPRNFISWCIVGSESGPKRRPMQLEWAESLRQQCNDAGVSFFMKQMEVDGKVTTDVSRFPVEMQSQEFPRNS